MIGELVNELRAIEASFRERGFGGDANGVRVAIEAIGAFEQKADRMLQVNRMLTKRLVLALVAMRDADRMRAAVPMISCVETKGWDESRARFLAECKGKDLEEST